MTFLRALTLAERARRITERTCEASFDRAVAERELAAYRAQASFADEAMLARRIAAGGPGFLPALGTPAEALGDPSLDPPDFAVAIDAALTRYERDRLAGETVPLEGLRRALSPLVHAARLRFRRDLDEKTCAALGVRREQAEQIVFNDLPWPVLSEMAARTLILELNVARLRGELAGDTAEARFACFAERLGAADTARRIFDDFPVLARQLWIRLEQWLDARLELLARLAADFERLTAALLGGAHPGSLISIEGSKGDGHRGGRSVGILTFEGGARLVYKPRSLAVERHFGELVAWLNARMRGPALRVLGVVDRGHYGWVEHVGAGDCESPEAVDRFYRRVGALVAVLHALDVSDVHSENLLAAGEHPVLIDLECMLQPRLYAHHDLAGRALRGGDEFRTVLRSGILPYRSWGLGGGAGVDVSALGARTGQILPDRASVLADAGTDDSRFVRVAIPLDEDLRSRPTFDGRPCETRDHAAAIVEGFETTYGDLVRHRDELLAPEGPLARFAHDEVRLLLRDTRTYGLLLQEGFHPDLLGDALARDRHFDRLWFDVPNRPYLEGVIASEVEDLWRGDIPLFTTRPGSRDLWDAAGRRFADFLDEPSLVAAERHVRSLDDADLARQRWAVDAALRTLAMEPGQDQRPWHAPGEARAPAQTAALVDEATAIGDRLARLAFRGDDLACWAGLIKYGDTWTVDVMGFPLYAGGAGIALFLTALSTFPGGARFAELAQMATEGFRLGAGKWIENPAFRAPIGGYSGWGGVMYALSCIGVIAGRPALVDQAEHIAASLGDRIPADTQNDVLDGAAGCIGGLLCVHRVSGAPAALRAAIRCGEQLLARAVPAGRGLGWPVTGLSETPLTGFAHGAAGVGWALLELAAVTGDERFRAAGEAAFAFEQGAYRAERGVWPTLLPREDVPAGELAAGDALADWCYGAGGIGLSRARAYELFPDPGIEEALRAALAAVRAHGFEGSHCLCHGDFGSVELLLAAARALGDDALRAEALQRGAGALESVRRDGRLCGVPLAVETPGLMNGIAGIGYGLLRLAAPERLPNVLLLEAPSR